MRYEVRTLREPADILARAVTHFGSEGTGLRVGSQTMFGVVFEGGGGYVAVLVRPDVEDTVVELETREWDFPVRQFMKAIHQPRRWWHRWRPRRSRDVMPAASPFHILDNDE